MGGGLPAKYLLPFCCIGDILKFNMQHVYVLKKLYFDTKTPNVGGGGGGGGFGGGGSAGKIFLTMLLHV